MIRTIVLAIAAVALLSGAGMAADSTQSRISQLTSQQKKALGVSLPKLWIKIRNSMPICKGCVAKLHR